MSFHTIVIAVPDLFDQDWVEERVTAVIQTVPILRDKARVVEYHHERMTGEPCRECGSWPEGCPGGRGHDHQKET